MSITNFVQILIEALTKKERLMDELLKLCKQQEECLKKEEANVDEYVECSNKKAELSKKIELIDEGFISVYDRIKDELETNSVDYADDIRKMKALVTAISDKTASLNVFEQRLKADFKKRMGKSTKSNAKYTSGAAQKYAQTMKGQGSSGSTFINKKQ